MIPVCADRIPTSAARSVAPNTRRALGARSLCSLLIAICAILFTVPAPAASLVPNLLLVHGRVYTAAENAKWAQAIAISGDRIVAVGDDADILRLQSASTKVVDLRGAMVTPGFIDSHEHLLLGSAGLFQLNLSLPDKSISPSDGDLFFNAIRDYARVLSNNKIEADQAAARL